MGNAFDLARRIRIDTIQAMVEADVLSFEDGLELLTEPLTPGDEQTRFDDSEHLACPKCHQKINGQTGEYPCSVCGLPTLHDQEDRPMALDQITVATVTLEDTDRIRQWFIDLEDVLDAAKGENRCEVSHYVKHQDEGQMVTDYDYYWCNTHACICDPDGCAWGTTKED